MYSLGCQSVSLVVVERGYMIYKMSGYNYYS